MNQVELKIRRKALTPFYRILKVLSEEELTITQIELKARVNHKTAVSNLILLKEARIVHETSLGRVKMYKLNKDNEKVQILIKLLSSWP
ncbi:MAG: ArsR family transcriptional regulator [Thermoproteota archaeon]|nr:ArsR family transcriptional regulator [Candidatus Brockarchaeota archaeon]MBO3800730.1 ArsR family transcriptional regulator [Candidatus Brockarchaeota archaeon]